jgi:hypothetical protein
MRIYTDPHLTQPSPRPPLPEPPAAPADRYEPSLGEKLVWAGGRLLAGGLRVAACATVVTTAALTRMPCGAALAAGAVGGAVAAALLHHLDAHYA